MKDNNESIRKGYEELGVDEFYKVNHESYSNPHEEIISDLLKEAFKRKYIGQSIIDLSCGSGEVSFALKDKVSKITATDPYTADAYLKRMGSLPLNINFKDIVNGKLVEKADTIISSFAMHLCEESMLPSLLWALSNNADTLIIITPHKRPKCNQISGWTLIDSIEKDRVKLKVYKHNQR